MIESHLIYTVVKGVAVLVVDKHMQLHRHEMQHDREIRADTRLSEGDPHKDLIFRSIADTHRWTMNELENLKLWVFVTENPLWPYIIIREDHLQGKYAAIECQG